MLDNRLAQRVVWATTMFGIAIVFILSGREPGWQPFAVSGLLALSFLITAFLFPDNSQWVGFLALAVLLMTMFWQRDNPMAAFIGVILTILNALSARRNGVAGGSGEAKPRGEPSEPAMPAEPS
jgi:hypothetical protein